MQCEKCGYTEHDNGTCKACGFYEAVEPLPNRLQELFDYLKKTLNLS